MLSRIAVGGVRCGRTIVKAFSRNIGVTAACYQKTQTAAASDPIQKLFIDKIHEYDQKSKASGGKLVDASAATEKNMQDELEKLARQYGAKGADFAKFPTFTFTDPDLEPVGVQVEIKEVAPVEEEEDAVSQEDETKPYWEP